MRQTLLLIIALILAGCSLEKKMYKSPARACNIAEGLCFQRSDTPLVASNLSEREYIDSSYDEGIDSSIVHIVFAVDDSCNITIKELTKENSGLQDSLSFMDGVLHYWMTKKNKTRVIKETVIDSVFVPEMIFTERPLNIQNQKTIEKQKQKIKARNKAIGILSGCLLFLLLVVGFLIRGKFR